VEEVIKEDYSKDGPVLRDDVLKRLRVADEKPKVVKPQISFKGIIVEGIQGLGGTAQAFTDISMKIDENQTILENEKKGFIHKIKKIFHQMLNKGSFIKCSTKSRNRLFMMWSTLIP